VSHLSGSEGPLRTLLDRLRPFGLGERVIKTTLAVGLSWELARLIPGNPNPVLAAMTGMFSINLTIASSVKDAFQRIVGMIWGVAIALIVNWALGLSGWSLAVTVLISFAGARLIRLEAAGMAQVAVTALLVILAAAGTQANTSRSCTSSTPSSAPSSVSSSTPPSRRRAIYRPPAPPFRAWGNASPSSSTTSPALSPAHHRRRSPELPGTRPRHRH